ncbi:MAG: IS1634 family transposase [Candidatus Latescibacterota bacterium]
MFIKPITKRNRLSGKSYTYHRLLESYRSSRGPRHEVLLNLGRLELPKELWKLLADRIEQIGSGQPRLLPAPEEVERLALHYAALLKQRRRQRAQAASEPREPGPLVRSVDLRSVRVSTVRTIGAEYVGAAEARRLGLERILGESGLGDGELRGALALIVGRLVAPASERATRIWLRERSGLSELLGAQIKGLSLNALYRLTDALYERKGRIEELLRGAEQTLFGLQEEVILYDLTNTYFEGSCYHSKELAHGKSKERRNDCLLMTVGLVVDEWGFAKRSGLFAGNASEPETMLTMLKDLGAAPGATVIIDAGIGTEKNLKKLRGWGYQYICVARGQPLEGEDDSDEGMVLIRAEREKIVRGKLVKTGAERVLRCHSSEREAKEQGMKRGFQKRFEEGLEQIRGALHTKRGTKDYRKVLERIGRLKERSHGIHEYYEIEVQQNDQIATDIRWSFRGAKEADERYSGVYYLRTSRDDLDEKSLWELYITLEGIEDSFRSLKGELGLRPVFHFKECRIKAHLFIAVLAYHLLSAIRHRLRDRGYLARWSTIRAKLSTHVMSTVSMKSETGSRISIRTPSRPEPAVGDIYRALGLRLNPLPVRRSEGAEM